jgi:hypothetical protein
MFKDQGGAKLLVQGSMFKVQESRLFFELSVRTLTFELPIELAARPLTLEP